MHKVVTIFGAAASFAIASPAVAGVVIYDSPGPVQPDENVLFQTNNQTGGTVTGITNQTDTNVFFTSTTDSLLTTSAQGQARIVASDGLINQLTLASGPLTFTEAEFNLFGATQGDMITFTTSCLDSTNCNITTDNTFTLGNGQNFFGIKAADGTVLTSVSFTSSAGIEAVKQVRIAGLNAVNGAVPEPATWAMMLFGFGAVGFGMRRRRSQKQGKLRVRFAV